jgi:hypothetical protein
MNWIQMFRPSYCASIANARAMPSTSRHEAADPSAIWGIVPVKHFKNQTLAAASSHKSLDLPSPVNGPSEWSPAPIYMLRTAWRVVVRKMRPDDVWGQTAQRVFKPAVVGGMRRVETHAGQVRVQLRNNTLKPKVRQTVDALNRQPHARAIGRP